METDRLLSRIEAFCAAHDLSPSTFGRKAVNDGKLVDRLRAGKTITLHTLARVDRFMAEASASRRPSQQASAA